MMTTPVLSEHFAAYATRVRAHLADLEPDVVEDLTDGLEADLAEALADAAPERAGHSEVAAAEGDELTARFGAPEEYAAELRSAAGFPAAGPTERAGRAPWRVRVRAAAHELVAPLRAQIARFATTSQGAFLVGFGRSIAPVWWVARAWVLGGFIGGMFTVYEIRFIPESDPWVVLVMVVLAFLSVQVGRGALRLGRGWRRAAVVANVVAAVYFVPYVAMAQDAANQIAYFSPLDSSDESAPADAAGSEAEAVYVGGERATNLFVYGPDGELIDGAQVVDQSGRPVLLAPDGTLDSPDGDRITHFWEPRTDVNSREVWNAYPLGFWDIESGVWDETVNRWTAPDGVAGSTQAPTIDRLVPLATDEAETPSDSPLEIEPSGEPLDTELSSEAPSDAPSTETGTE